MRQPAASTHLPPYPQKADGSLIWLALASQPDSGLTAHVGWRLRAAPTPRAIRPLHRYTWDRSDRQTVRHVLLRLTRRQHRTRVIPCTVKKIFTRFIVILTNFTNQMRVNFTLKHAYPYTHTHLVSEICQDNKKRVNIFFLLCDVMVTRWLEVYNYVCMYV